MYEPSLRVGGFEFDTNTISTPTRHFGGATSFAANERHRLDKGLARLLGHAPPRLLAEFLVEVAERRLSRSEMLDRLDSYAAVSRDRLRRGGGDLYPAFRLREVP